MCGLRSTGSFARRAGVPSLASIIRSPKVCSQITFRPSGVPHSFAVFANEWARRTALVIKFLHRAAFNFERPLLIIHSHCSNFTVKVRAKTAPLPLFGSFHQSALCGIPVHVTQLLD